LFEGEFVSGRMMIGSGSSTVPSGATRTPTMSEKKYQSGRCVTHTTSQFVPFQATTGSVWLCPWLAITIGVVSIRVPLASKRAP
jgi:hypothetical protein